jgi:hypothetical protein
MDKITAVGLDLAKQIIQVHAIDATGRVVLARWCGGSGCWRCWRSFRAA